MKSLNTPLLLLAVVGGLAAAFQAGRLTAKKDQPAQQQAAVVALQAEREKLQPLGKMIDVVVAKKDLPVGTLLEDRKLEEYVGTMKFAEECIPPGAICDFKELRNKKLNRTLRQGNYFSSDDVTEEVGIKIPEGMFQYTIKVDGCYLQTGDRVDVIFTEILPNGKFKSSLVLRDMLVLSVNFAGHEPSIPSNVVAVGLAMTSEQSLILSSCEKRGELRLIFAMQKTACQERWASKFLTGCLRTL